MRVRIVFLYYFLAGKFRFWKPAEFRNDYLLHYYPTGSGKDISDGLILPEKMIQILEKPNWNYSHQNNKLDLTSNCVWLNLEDGGI